MDDIIGTLKNKKLAIFDLDGTFYRDSLFIAITKAMCAEDEAGGFPKRRYSSRKLIQEAEKAWRDRETDYGSYIRVVVEVFSNNIKGAEKEQVISKAKAVMRQMNQQVHIFTRELFNICRESYYTIAITGSQIEIVEAFKKYWPFDYVLSTVFEVDRDSRYTGKVIKEAVVDKQRSLLELIVGDKSLLKDSIGIGDSNKDVAFLEMVDKPICFNPNHVFAEQALERGWPVVVERKNVIWIIQKNKVLPWHSADIKALRKNITKLIK